MKGTVTIRVYAKDINKMKRALKPLKGESLANYIERYVKEFTQ